MLFLHNCVTGLVSAFINITECVAKTGDLELLGQLSSEFREKTSDNGNRPWWQCIQTHNGVHKFNFTEASAKTGMVLLLGEISSSAQVNIQQVVRDTIKQIGYDDCDKGNVVRWEVVGCVSLSV